MRADRQTAGRGRRGRAWVSEAGNLYASLLLKPRPTDPPRQQISFVTAVALHDTIAALVPNRDIGLQMKWPNDLLLQGHKVSGILLESTGGALVVGVGVNLAHHPDNAERPATDLAMHGFHVSPADFLLGLQSTFASRHALWRAAGFLPIRDAWLARAAYLEQPIEARLGTETLTGIFETLDADGALRLRLPDGSRRAIHAGEVFGMEG